MPQLNFRGKPFVQNLHFTVPYHELIPQKEKSLTGKISLHDNLIVHGDNLLALKALLPTHAGKVKCIYIDPPYNTGNEGWAYNDNVNSPIMKEWLGKTVDREDLTRHDKWLCMMTPRLKLLRELLRDDGVIFISIDDNEVHHLRMLMDEIFGEENFVADIIWQKKYSPQNDAKYFSDMHDFIICYAKHRNAGEVTSGWERNLLSRNGNMDARYTNPDNDPRGPWKSSDLSVRTYVESTDYPIETPSGRTVYPPKSRSWSVSVDRLTELIKDGRIWFGKDGKSVPSLKRFLSEVKEGIVPQTIWYRDEVGDNEKAKKEIKIILDDSDITFDSPKPASLVTKILRLASDPNSIVLDSFAGSGTTAQAVLQLNKEDGGNRKFVLIEMEDYADKLTAERVRRVIKGVPASKNEGLKNGLGGTFSYFELGKPIEVDSILSGKNMPSYDELARYVFFTATGEEFDGSKVDEKTNFIGDNKEYQVYLLYKPDVEYLRKTALTLDFVKQLPPLNGKKRLVFAPTKYLDQNQLDEHRILFAQLPFEIYQLTK